MGRPVRKSLTKIYGNGKKESYHGRINRNEKGVSGEEKRRGLNNEFNFNLNIDLDLSVVHSFS